MAACSGDGRPGGSPPPAPRASPTPPTPTAAQEAAPAHGPTPPRLAPSSPGAPDLAALRALLRSHRSVRFDTAAQDRGCPADQDLGAYLALLVRYGERGDSPGDVHQLAGTCLDSVREADRLALDPPADPAYWTCRIDAYTCDPEGDSPWHYELRLRVRKMDGTPDLTTMACPGAP